MASTPPSHSLSRPHLLSRPRHCNPNQHCSTPLRVRFARSPTSLTCSKPMHFRRNQRKFPVSLTRFTPLSRIAISLGSSGGGSLEQSSAAAAEECAEVSARVLSVVDGGGSLEQSNATAVQESSEVSTRIWSAVGLIMGTAIGPGILGLPASMINSGIIPSSLLIVAAWFYVIGSVLLVVDLTYEVMEQQGGEQVSYTGLAVYTLGKLAGSVVSIVYASLNYALLVACISGLASVIGRWLPATPQPLICILCTTLVGLSVAMSSFKMIDVLNKFLCVIMVASISCLVSVGASLGRSHILTSFSHCDWSFHALLPGAPVTVLTLGFHVVTPLICKVVGGKPENACKAVIRGGLVPLFMVLSWNIVILGLTPSHASSTRIDPINLLLSISSFAAPAVQAFAFSALGTTLIGYALSFPKQLLDTLSIFILHENMQTTGKSLLHRSKPFLSLTKTVGSLRSQTNKKEIACVCQYEEGSVENVGKCGTVLFSEVNTGRMGEVQFSECPAILEDTNLLDDKRGCKGMQDLATSKEISGAKNAWPEIVSSRRVVEPSALCAEVGREDLLLSDQTSISATSRVMPAIRQQSSAERLQRSSSDRDWLHLVSLILALVPPTIAAGFYSSAFIAALDFAGIYANCFLFGVLPPIMAYVSRYGTPSRHVHHQRKPQVSLLPGGKLSLALLLVISIYLGVANA